jgi:hypothetical protein
VKIGNPEPAEDRLDIVRRRQAQGVNADQQALAKHRKSRTHVLRCQRL